MTNQTLQMSPTRVSGVPVLAPSTASVRAPGAAAAPFWRPTASLCAQAMGRAVGAFLDVATTSYGRATQYNSRIEQQAAELIAHQAMLAADRDVYAVMLALPGVTDRAVQIGVRALLATTAERHDRRLDVPTETRLIERLTHGLPAHRMMRLFESLRESVDALGLPRANNARARKLALRTLLRSPRIELWSVKYRRRFRNALVHAWGQRTAGALKAILARGVGDTSAWTAKECRIVHDAVVRHIQRPDAARRSDVDGKGRLAKVLECVAFVLGVREGLTLPLLQAYGAARGDLTLGARLPLEVLEGLRSTFHREVDKDEVLRITAAAGSLTSGQKMAVQRRAKDAGVKVEFDPSKQDAVKLYLYAFEQGLSLPIARALDAKAAQAAARFPVRWDRVAVLLDASGSMAGDATQALRPMAVALALRDVLVKLGTDSRVHVCGGDGQAGGSSRGLVRPKGATALAEGLLDLLDPAGSSEAGRDPAAPDAVFVVSDGYENRPAGRFAEVMGALRDIGVQTPVFHFNPVLAAEAGATRDLAAGLVPTLPIREPKALATSFVRGLVEVDPIRAIDALVSIALKGDRKEALASIPAGIDPVGAHPKAALAMA